MLASTIAVLQLLYVDVLYATLIFLLFEDIMVSEVYFQQGEKEKEKNKTKHEKKIDFISHRNLYNPLGMRIKQ